MSLYKLFFLPGSQSTVNSTVVNPFSPTDKNAIGFVTVGIKPLLTTPPIF
jgi:hypothetical protein